MSTTEHMKCTTLYAIHLIDGIVFLPNVCMRGKHPAQRTWSPLKPSRLRTLQLIGIYQLQNIVFM